MYKPEDRLCANNHNGKNRPALQNLDGFVRRVVFHIKIKSVSKRRGTSYSLPGKRIMNPFRLEEEERKR